MEVLKPIYAAIALLGIHILQPYYCLLMNPETNYSTLLNAFPQLYEELSTIYANQLLKTDQVLFFVSSDTFKNSLPDDDLLKTIAECCETYPQETERLISLCLQKFASGFAYQKGAIVGFSNKSNDDTGAVLKISELKDKDLEQLNNVPVHNIGEERSVGLFNYEITLRGKKNIDAASRKMILKKSSDLIHDKSNEVRDFKKQAVEIKELKTTWSKNMTELQKKGYSEKDILNTKKENQKLVDLEFLQKQQPPGPFTQSQQVKQYLEEAPEGKYKNHRMYIETRFQRNTSTTLKNDAAIFRLKKDGKNLETQDYCLNLCQYLDQSRSVGNVSMGDLRNVLNCLEGITGKSSTAENVLERNDSGESVIPFKHGETVAGVWHEDVGDLLEWHLGVVDKIDDNGVYISYMKSSDKKGFNWLFPDEADIQLTSFNQIIARNIQVAYSLTAVIRCRISIETLNYIQNRFNEYG